MLVELLALVALLVFSAFFSSSETALTSISEDMLQKKVEEKDQKSKRIQNLLKKKS